MNRVHPDSVVAAAGLVSDTAADRWPDLHSAELAAEAAAA